MGFGGATGSTGIAAIGIAAAPAFQPGGGSTRTMLWHFGHATISPIADVSVTFRRALQVVQ